MKTKEERTFPLYQSSPQAGSVQLDHENQCFYLLSICCVLGSVSGALGIISFISLYLLSLLQKQFAAME